MSIDVTGAYVYFVIPILGGIPISQTVVSSLIVTIIMCTAFILLGKNLEKRPGKLQVLVEKGVSMITNLTCSAMGEHNKHWTPFMGALFLYIIIGNYLGTTGFLRSPTADLNCTATLALMVSFIIWYNTIKNNGIGPFLKNYLNPMNIIGDLAQPLSMSFRLFSNISVGGIISAIIYGALTLLTSVLVGIVSNNGWLMGIVLTAAGILMFFFWARKTGKLFHKILSFVTFAIGFFGLLEVFNILTGVPVFTYGIPAVLSVYFDFFCGFIQSMVFTLLSMVYIAGSLPEPEAAEAA